MIFREHPFELSKIPPRYPTRKNKASSSSVPGTSANPPRRGRSAKNLGQATDLPSSSRRKSQEPIARRVEERISASRANTARRASITTPTEPLGTVEPITTTFPNSNLSPLTSISTSSMPDNAPVLPPMRKMPKPSEKNAPVFDPEKPEELGRFFDRIEDWFSEDGITDDIEKKAKIVKYMDIDSEQQWKALSKFAVGTFAEFKAQVMASYPKAEEVTKGSVTALKKKIRRLGPIELDQRDDLLAMIRVVTAEVAKLKLIQPPIHTNRELVDLFLGGLTPEFSRRVADILAVRRMWQADQPLGEGAQDRNPEDMFDIEDVMEMAKHASLENVNTFGKYLWNSPSGTSDKTVVKLEEAIARLTDNATIQTKFNQQLQAFMTQSKAAPVATQQVGAYAPRPGWERGFAPTSNHIQGSFECFYCREPHRVGDCEHAHKHLDLGWIVRIDRQLRMPDGSKIQRDGNKSMKEVIEALNKKPGVILMSKIQDSSSFYQGGSSGASFSQSQGISSEAATMRAFMEMMQKVGLDRVQHLIDNQRVAEQQEPFIEDEEWNQNFD